MRWLRTQRDMIGLIAVWGLLLQSLAVPFSMGAHAAPHAAGDIAASGMNIALQCATPGAISTPVLALVPEGEKQSQNGSDCGCCNMACHASCGGTCGGLLPAYARVALPGDAILTAASLTLRAQIARSKGAHQKEARAPPAGSKLT